MRVAVLNRRIVKWHNAHRLDGFAGGYGSTESAWRKSAGKWAVEDKLGSRYVRGEVCSSTHRRDMKSSA